MRCASMSIRARISARRSTGCPTGSCRGTGKYIICATHGAAFAPTTGECLLGPCKGDYLDAVKTEIRDGVIYVPADAGL